MSGDDRRRVDVLVLTALLDELEAVLGLGEGGRSGWKDGDDSMGLPFHVRSIPRSGGRPLTLAAAWSGGMGEVAVTERARALARHLSPRWVTMCGICAGKRGDVALGDVIVADRVFSYDHGKLIASTSSSGVRHEEIFRDIMTYNLRDPWLTRVSYFARDLSWSADLVTRRPVSLEQQAGWLLRALLRQEDVLLHPERATACPDWKRTLVHLQKRGLIAYEQQSVILTVEGRSAAQRAWIESPDALPRDRPLRVHVGPIATGKTVQVDPEIFDRIGRFSRKAIGIEMEAAAIGFVAERIGVPSLIAKAVSDFADHDKDDGFRAFACSASASFLLAFFLQQELDDTGDVEPAATHDAATRRQHARRRLVELKKQNVSAVELAEARAELRAAKVAARVTRTVEAEQVLSNRFELVQQLGHGGFGTVWQAFDREDERYVAVKILHDHHVNNRPRRERFFKAAARMATLSHHNIVRVFERQLTHDTFHYFVMELIEGTDLRQWVQRSPSIAGVRGIVQQIADALEHAHANGIIHRDVKPANILVNDRGHAWLTDFDLIQVDDSSWGTRGEPLGTFLFSAPEVLAGDEADRRSDVFSLGMVALYCLRGGNLSRDTLYRTSSVVASLPVNDGIKRTLIQAIHREPERRLGSITEFAERLARDAAMEAPRPMTPSRDVGTVGIDFGTTTSFVSAYINGHPTIIPNRFGSKSTPSMVAFDPDGTYSVGAPALSRTALSPELAVFGVKRRLGTNWVLSVGGTQYSARDIVSLILRQLKNDLESSNVEFDSVVMTVPAYFSLRQRDELREAAHMAGLHVIRMVVEPTAAAFAHHHLKGDPVDKVDEVSCTVVCDLGGGTFDVSVVEIGDRVTDVLATSGDTMLGGDDYDERLVDYLRAVLRQKYGIDVIDATTLLRIRQAAEQAKIQLSTMPSARVRVPYLSIDTSGQPVHLDEEITRERFDNLVLELVERMLRCCQAALKSWGKAGIRGEIDTLLLVGLSTRIPIVKRALSELFGLEPNWSVDADEAVAIGAAVQAGVLQGRVKHVLLIDVMSRALGYILDGVVRRVVEANTTVPHKRDDKAVMTTKSHLHIVHAESTIPSECILLAELSFASLFEAEQKEIMIVVGFNIDADQAFIVTVTEARTRKAVSISLH